MECGLLKESRDEMIAVLFIFDLVGGGWGGGEYVFARGTEEGKSFVSAKP